MDLSRRKVLIAGFGLSATCSAPRQAISSSSVRICVPELPIYGDCGVSSYIPDKELLQRNLFESLVEQDTSAPSGYRLVLLKSLKVDSSGKIYHMQLRRDVEFHRCNGFIPSRPLNAEDVIYSLQRHSDFRLNLAHSSPNSRKIASVIKSIQALSEFELQIETLDTDQAALFDCLSSYYSLIVSSEYAHWLENRGRMRESLVLPVATGPYKLSHLSSNKARLEPHRGYRAPVPSVAFIDVLEVPNMLDRYSLLRTAKCHAATSLSSSLMRALKLSKIDYVQRQNSPHWLFLAIGDANPALKSKEFKALISQSINRHQLSHLHFVDGSGPQTSLINRQPDAMRDERTSKALNKESIVRMIEQLPETLELSISSQAGPGQFSAPLVAQSIKQQLSSIGVNVILRDFDPLDKLEAMRGGHFDLALVTQSALDHSPFAYLEQLGLLERDAGFMRWHKPELNQLVQSYKSTKSADRREQILAEIDQFCEQYCPVIPLLGLPRLDGVQPSLQGLKSTYDYQLDLRNLRLQG